MRLKRAITSGILMICLPLLIITTVLRWEINDIHLYKNGFEKYRISEVTGIDAKQLDDIAQHLIDYFNLRIDTVQYTVVLKDRQIDLFSERGIMHFEDVRNLFQLDYRVQILSFSLVIICVLVLLLGFRERWIVVLKSLFWGSIITVSFMAFLALLAVIGFERLFVLFHTVSFSNQYWILDPSEDYIIMLLPEGFFFDAALLCFGVVILVSLIIGIASFTAMRMRSNEKLA